MVYLNLSIIGREVNCMKIYPNVKDRLSNKFQRLQVLDIKRNVAFVSSVITIIVNRRISGPTFFLLIAAKETGCLFPYVNISSFVFGIHCYDRKEY
jgi:hypothetical protein